MSKAESEDTPNQSLQMRGNQATRSSVDPLEDWGSETQPYWRPGPNPTVDNIITRNKGQEILLIRRSSAEGVAEAGKLALPGGFWDTDAAKGEPWLPGRETARQADLRELTEETGLSIDQLEKHLRPVGRFDRFGRDPRDNEKAFSVSEAFALDLPDSADTEVQGLDDAEDAGWFRLDQIKNFDLAFDHEEIIAKAFNW